MRNGDEASPSINLACQAFSENAQNSWTTWCILIKFCMLLYYYLDWELPEFSVVNKIVILPLALKRFISQEEISPFSQNFFKIC